MLTDRNAFKPIVACCVALRRWTFRHGRAVNAWRLRRLDQDQVLSAREISAQLLFCCVLMVFSSRTPTGRRGPPVRKVVRRPKSCTIRRRRVSKILAFRRISEIVGVWLKARSRWQASPSHFLVAKVGTSVMLSTRTSEHKAMKAPPTILSPKVNPH